MSKPIYIRDGESRELPNIWRLGCCDCGLVHRLEIDGDTAHIRVRFYRDVTATVEQRKANGHKGGWLTAFFRRHTYQVLE